MSDGLKALVVGLGQFGASVAVHLSDLGMDVIALDTNEKRVDAVADRVAQARVANGSDLAVLSDLRVDTMSAVLCAIGDEYLLDSILCTAHLHQLGAPRLIARATNEVHARVLRAVGAGEIIEPEREIGKVVARRIARAGIANQFEVGHGMSILEMEIPETWIDRDLVTLDLRRRANVTVAAVRRAGTTEWIPPSAQAKFGRGDYVLLLGSEEAVEAVAEGRAR